MRRPGRLIVFAPALLLAACAGTSGAAKDAGALGQGGTGSAGSAAGAGHPDAAYAPVPSGGASGAGGTTTTGSGGAGTGGASTSPATDTAAETAPGGGPAAPDGAASTGHVVYLGTQTHLLVYGFDVSTGALIEQQRIAMGVRTVYAAIAPDRRFLFAGHGESPGHVIAFAIDRATGQLTKINQTSTSDQGDTTGISHVAVHPSGKWVMTAHLASGRVSVMPIGADGRINPPTDTRILAIGAHFVAHDTAGKYALIPVRDGGYVAQFVVDPATGALTANTPARIASASGAGPRHLAIHPNQRFAYVNNESNGTVTTYAFDASTGKLTVIASVTSVPAGYNETGMGHVAVHPSGKFLYASNRFHGSIAAYTIDQATGRLQLLEVETGAGDIRFPRDFALDPAGNLLVVGNERGDSLLVLKIDPATGSLSKLGASVTTPQGPQVVLVMPLGS